MTRELIPGACPHPQMLSAYLDGKLDPTERGRIEDHISRCEDCYFVVRETALVWSEAGAEGAAPAGTESLTPGGGGEVVQATFGGDAATPAASAAVEVPAADPRRPKASSFARYFMPIAATLVVAAGALALWRQGQANADPRAALVAAVGERRFFDARLTGGFKFGERISPKRGGGLGTPDPSGPLPPVERSPSGPAAEDWEVLAAAAKLRKDIGTPRTPGETMTLASAHLVLGEVGEAVRLLERALRETENAGRTDARLLSDLAAAYLTRAINEDRAEDYPRALESASRAVELDPRLNEALYNRALALELLHLPNEAIKSWDAFLATEAEPRWRAEATSRRDALQGRARPDFEAMDREIQSRLETGTDAELDAAVRHNTGLARDLFDYGPSPARDGRSARLAASFLRVTGDPYQVDMLSGGEGETSLREFARARRLYDQDRWSEAASAFERSLQTAAPSGPIALWSGLYIALVQFQRNATATEAEFRRIRDVAGARGYRILAARASWVWAMARAARGDYSEALRGNREARKWFLDAGSEEFAGFMDQQIAEVFSALGDEGRAWTHRRLALQRAALLRDPGRRAVVFFSTNTQATRAGWGRVGMAALDEAISFIEPGQSDYASTMVSLARARAEAREVAEPSSGIHEIARAAEFLDQIPDGVTRERARGELDLTAAEIAPEKLSLIDTLDRAVTFATTRGAEERLPGILLTRSRVRHAAGDGSGALEDLRRGLRLFEDGSARLDDSHFSYFARAWALFEEEMKVAEVGGAAATLAVAERALEKEYRLGRELPEVGSRSDLAPGESLIVLFRGKATIRSWVISVHGVESSEFPVGPALARAARVRDALENGDRTALADSMKPMTESMLSAQQRGILEEADRVVVIPHRELGAVPFGLLQLSDGTPLCERAVVSLSPTVSFALDRQSVRRARRIAAVAVDQSARFPALPAARLEVDSVAAEYPVHKTLKGAAATRSAVLAEIAGSDVVHLATHGVTDDRYPGRARLVLSDYDLDAPWISSLQLRLRPDVLLAACRSSGSPEDLVGRFGLARAFLLAGAGSVMASTFDLRDGQAADLFVRIHRARAAGETLAEALNREQAQGWRDQTGAADPTAFMFAVFSPLTRHQPKHRPDRVTVS